MHLSLDAAFCAGCVLWHMLVLAGAESGNEIVGDCRYSVNPALGPLNVTCQGGSALISFKTRTTFTGRVYVKGAYARPQCNHDFSYRNNNDSALEMPLGDCSTQRDKAAGYERAFKYVSIVVISFHPKFVTKDDRAYRVECLYRTVEAEVTNELNISNLATESYVFQPPPPVCQYTLHMGNPSGPEAKDVRVGDSLFHKWNCDSGHYAIFVHSCYATGPGQEQVELLDEDGCSVDSQIMPNLTYSKALNESWVETRAFRYQDVESMRFNCKIKTCLKADTGCVESFPQKCVPVRRSRNRRSISKKPHFADQILYSPPVRLVEPFEDTVAGNWVNEHDFDQLPPTSSICFAKSAMVLLATSTLTLFCFALIMLSLIFKRRK